jgi:hypothetical protein
MYCFTSEVFVVQGFVEVFGRLLSEAPVAHAHSVVVVQEFIALLTGLVISVPPFDSISVFVLVVKTSLS